MKQLSERIRGVSASRTVRLSGVIDSLRRQGHDIINLGVGEPYEAPFPDILSKTTAALKGGETRYGPVAGIPELRNAISEKFDGYTGENILVTNGSKQALYTALQVLCDPGSQVIIPRPCWVSFCEQIKLAGATPVLVDTKAHQLDCHAIEKAINADTRAIIINSPNNPTGAVYPKEDLRAIADLAWAHDLYLISDEAYEAFVYDGWTHRSLFDFPHIRDRLIVAGSFSKTYCMTGFRIGYAAAPKEIITAMARLQSHLTGNVCTFAQHGALAAARRDPSHFHGWRNHLQKKRDMTLEMLKDLPCDTPRGAFYVFPDVIHCLKKNESAEDLASEILQRVNVAVAPGEAFGGDGHIRICYAIEEKRLIQGLERLVQVIHQRTGATAP
ncbi:MAG: pyridoxal phosphate-dependent aminotransferase [Deltaproteobacteria bacterium]|nr:pyridoxal phosphate-dependent aminotransferase [Deltaproteobacteria bacterium]